LKYIAHFFSFLFHPLLLPTYATILLISTNPYQYAGLAKGPFSILAIITPLTLFFPVVTIALMKALKFIDSFYLPSARQRFIPYIAIMIYYIWTFLVIYKNHFPTPICWMMLGSTIAIALAFILNSYIKISIHTVGMGCLLIIALYSTFHSYFYFVPILIICAIVAGLVGSSRLFLKAHYPNEVYLGYMVGFLGMQMASWFL
jgi:membrane-associated phospholipid phosphatase